MELPDFTDPTYGIPVFSLYGEVRRPTGQSMGTFDTILIDLQDLGCRIYTYVTTLLYVLEAAAEHGKSVWVLDRPTPPVGRSKVCRCVPAGRVSSAPARSRCGTALRLASWPLVRRPLQARCRLSRDRNGGLASDEDPGFGWPPERVWINPSPNAANLNMARAYAGTVMLEGTTLSEGRGTTRAARAVRRPDLEPRADYRRNGRLAPEWLAGCKLRDTTFQPTFHKHVGEMCRGVFIHAEGPFYDHEAFQPWRLQSLAFKAIRRLYPDYPCGATSLTNMSSTSSPSTSSTARPASRMGRRSERRGRGPRRDHSCRTKAAWEEQRQATSSTDPPTRG